MDADRELVGRCLKHEIASQYELYYRFAPRMFGVCLRYSSSFVEAQDLLQEGFIRVFKKLYMYRFEGPLEGWIKRIIVHVAINYYKAQLKFQSDVDLQGAMLHATNDEDALSKLSAEELLNVIQCMPVGYRTVFNLYVMEGYNHREIGNMLNIAENTSKSQLHRAKAYLRQKLSEMGISGTNYGRT